jgi:divalent metal cation (Fe/Co/Zn/Cd) transporter
MRPALPRRSLERISTQSPELPVLPLAPPRHDPPRRDEAWLRAAAQARALSWFSLVWMLAEGVVGLVAGFEAGSIGVVSWAIGSAVEGAAAVIVIVRFTGARRFSETAERRAQRWVAGSFFLLVPYVVYEAAAHLVGGETPERSWLAVALLVSSIVLMPLLGIAKRRLGERLGSPATAGEGTQNLLCALQGAVGLVGLLAAGAGAGFLDPVAALVIAAIATREGLALWRGDDGCCSTPLPGLDAPAACRDDCCGG